jgi:hypothetical protein
MVPGSSTKTKTSTKPIASMMMDIDGYIPDVLAKSDSDPDLLPETKLGPKKYLIELN